MVRESGPTSRFDSRSCGLACCGNDVEDFVFLTGFHQMTTCKRVSLWSAARQVQGYPQLLINLAVRIGITVEKLERGRYLNSDDVERLRPLVKEWRERPRMSRPPRRQPRP